MDAKENRTFCIALCHIAAGHHISLGSHLNSCKQLQIHSCDEELHTETPCTWKVDGSIFITLIKDCNGMPLIYFHCNDCIYDQNPMTGLGVGPAFPVNSAVLAQYYLDDEKIDEDGVTPIYRKVCNVSAC